MNQKLSIFVPRSSDGKEKRVAILPETVAKYHNIGGDVMVQSGIGDHCRISDGDYRKAGAKVVSDAASGYQKANLILGLGASASLARGASPGSMMVTMDGGNDAAYHQACAAAGISTFCLDIMPRVTRAQAMDVLSSQSNLVGYRAVIEACAHFHRMLPLMMTAAGTIPAARIFIIGAGVAGLQAIATARRLGAIVTAIDVRPSVKEQVESLGANFLDVDGGEETSGGYAKTMGVAYRRRQEKRMAQHLPKQDIVITTALIPGKPAPKMIPASVVKKMKPGSVIIDLAAAAGGNCDGTSPGKIVEKDGVIIIGYTDFPSRIALDASRLYANNLVHFVTLLSGSKDGIDWQDEILDGTGVVRNGTIHRRKHGS